MSHWSWLPGTETCFPTISSFQFPGTGCSFEEHLEIFSLPQGPPLYLHGNASPVQSGHFLRQTSPEARKALHSGRVMASHAPL